MKKQSIMKSIALLCACTQLLSTTPFTIDATADETMFFQTAVQTDAGFNASNVVLTFGVLSDVHIGFGTNTRTFHSALSYYKDNYDLDGLFFSGDLTQSGTLGEATEFIRIIENYYDPAQTPIMACYGNHDTYMYTDKYLDEFGFYDAFYAENNDLYNFDVGTTEQIRAGNRLTKVPTSDGKYYYFVCAELATYGGTNTKFSDSSYAWLDQTLAQVTSENPDQYVFVAVHAPSSDTVAGSYSVHNSVPGTAQTSEILNKYPQAMLFTGHTHFPTHDDLSIRQGDYTQVHVGAESDVDLPTAVSEDRHDYSAGQVVEVDKNGYVRITRLDFMNKTQIREPWELSPCKADGSHLNTYRFETREENNENPYFEEDANIDVDELLSGAVKLTFDRAKDDMMVFSYEITVTDANGNQVPVTVSDEKSRLHYESEQYYKGIIDDFYDYPNPADIPADKSLILSFASAPSYPYTVSVVAYDSFGAYLPYGSAAQGSAPLTITVTDRASENKKSATAFDDAVKALVASSNYTSEQVIAVRLQYANLSTKAKALTKCYQTFVEFEREYYRTLSVQSGVVSNITADVMDSYLSRTTKGNVQNAQKGVTIQWNSAPGNSLIGTKHRYSVNDLQIHMQNLTYTSTENRTFAVILTAERGDKWVDDESALVWFDMETGRVYYGDDVYLGTSKYFKADTLGASAFTITFQNQADGALRMRVDTVYGSETFYIGAKFVEKMYNYSGKDYVYIYFTPWSYRQSFTLDLIAVL